MKFDPNSARTGPSRPIADDHLVDASEALCIAYKALIVIRERRTEGVRVESMVEKAITSIEELIGEDTAREWYEGEGWRG